MSSVDLPDRVLRKKKELEIDRLFQALVKLAGSDLHLKVDRPPYVRVKGALRTLNRGPIDDEEMNRLIFPMMDERNRKIYNDTGGADFAHTCVVDGVKWRFRVNVLTQMGHVGLVARRINTLLFFSSARSADGSDAMSRESAEAAELRRLSLMR